MTWHQRPNWVRITARAVPDETGMRWAIRHGAIRQQIAPETQVQIVRCTTVFAPTNTRDARKPGTSDETTWEVLYTLPIAAAASLATALVHSCIDAGAIIADPLVEPEERSA